MKRRTGFAFDYSPEIAKGRIITLKEDVEKRVNVGDAVSEWENKLIIGDNFNAIKSLLVTHKGKFDAIYIDPPYNTEKTKEDGNQSAKEGESAKFIYKDKFGRTGWLTFLKDRLSLAKELLKQQGVIFISIDDSEQAYLKVLMDDIFGEENFISNVYWRSRSSQNYSDKHISNVGEYVIIYAKDKSSLAEFNKDKSNPTDYKNLDNDPRGPWTSSGIIRDDGRKKYTVVSPSGKKMTEAWLYTEENFKNFDDEGRIWWGKNGDGIPRKKSYLNEWNGNPYISAIIQKGITTEAGTNVLKQIFGTPVFDFPKPPSLIKMLINLIDNPDALILDFFAGSGTTGQAVMELNSEDNGRRRFVLCTNNESNIAEEITFERLHRIIKGTTWKGNEKVEWANKNKIFDNQKLRVISIDDKVKISLDTDVSDDVYESVKRGLQLLDPKYNKKDLNLFYDLAALNPLEEEEN